MGSQPKKVVSVVVDHPRHAVDQTVDPQLAEQPVATVHLCNVCMYHHQASKRDTVLQMICRRSAASGSHLAAS